MNKGKLIASMLVGASVGTIAYLMTDKNVMCEMKDAYKDAKNKMKEIKADIK